MKLTSPLLRTVDSPTLRDVGAAIDALAEIGRRDPGAADRFLILEADDGTGAFIQAIAIDNHPVWHVEVANSSEAALRGLREPVSRGRAAEYFTRFLNGERSLGNGEEWIDVDVDAAAGRPAVTPAGLALLILAILAGAVGIYYFIRR